MKKTITILFVLCLNVSLFAQSPQKMSYQAVIRNSNNTLVSSSPIGMRVSIKQGSSSGADVYVEKHTATTNYNGLVSIEIGGGTPISGTFAAINWAAGPIFWKQKPIPLVGQITPS